ncbi:hypothetical protein [Actinomadura sp. 7K507]|uniref:hypothetical protein n=1 Tax=Actinomadura sp. 7K507 TaxID=2530365 RepID=UPI0010CF60D3|nr:hypothetical protein [Actinomadura sp. 7K507]TDC78664.1 hypothetical protein E1285_37120 [Actinomadura sp. 7K507]
MPTSDSPDGQAGEAAEPLGGDQIAEPLKAWSRWLAGLLGFVLAGGGAVATFISKNQAGSVALLLLGGVFLIMAVTAAPVRGFRIGDNEFRLAQLRGEALEDLADESPEVAERALDVLAQYDPGILSDPRAAPVYGKVYSQFALANMQLMFPQANIEEQVTDGGVDAIIRTEDNKLLGIQLKYLSSRARITHSWFMRVQRYSINSMMPVLIVSNDTLPISGVVNEDGSIKLETSKGLVGAVTWTGPSDNAVLKKAIEQFAGSRVPPHTMHLKSTD